MMKLISVLLAFSLVACSSTTIVRSTDKDAKIYIDGEMRGVGSVTQTDTKTIFATTEVRMEKEGCQPMNFRLQRSEFDAGACAGGVFLLFPFLWIQKYKPEHNFEYTCRK